MLLIARTTADFRLLFARSNPCLRRSYGRPQSGGTRRSRKLAKPTSWTWAQLWLSYELGTVHACGKLISRIPFQLIINSKDESRSLQPTNFIINPTPSQHVPRKHRDYFDTKHQWSYDSDNQLRGSQFQEWAAQMHIRVSSPHPARWGLGSRKEALYCLLSRKRWQQARGARCCWRYNSGRHGPVEFWL